MSHFIDARFWLDSDGKHVWVRHKCRDLRENTTMLPWPTWQALPDGQVTPSVHCQDCDLHVMGQIAEPPGVGLWSMPSDPFVTPEAAA